MDIKRLQHEKEQLLNQDIKVSGWVRFNRVSKAIGFIELTDGTHINGVQLVYKADNKEVFEELSVIPLYSALTVEGKLVQGKNDIEVVVSKVVHLAKEDQEFPFGKKEHGLDFLRTVAHQRIKTKLFQSVMKIRSVAAFSIHEFYKQQGFIYVHTPIITGNDAEGAGEAFYISTKDKSTFFANQGSLTVSGQLHAEGYAQAMKKVYTFGPTFRAENSNTSRHAAEFWMIEPEATFTDYNGMMKYAWDMIKHVLHNVLKECSHELAVLEKYNNKNLTEQFNNFLNSDISKMEYREALKHLEAAVKHGVKFENSNIHFGMDLGSEHEKYISKEVVKGPVFVYNYPFTLKAFYMYQNEDQTVRGFDLLVPDIGELIGGSQREDRYDKLMHAIKVKNIPTQGLEWYIDMRKGGYAPSSGFGLGFERLVMYLTGMENIRDVIPFPRTPGKLEY